MKIIQLTIGIVFLLLSNKTVSGQNSYKSGYIVTNNNDTIYGLIKLRSNYLNNRSCNFKKVAEDSPELLSPSDIKAYKIENSKFYISKIISLRDTNRVVFLEFLLDGIVNLYYFKDIVEEYFFIEKDNTLYELSNERKIITKDYDQFFWNSNQYIGALSYLFKESPELSDKIKKTGFSYKSLIKITEDYHNNVCKEYECINYTKSTKIKICLEPNISLVNSWMGLKTSTDLAQNTKLAIGINFKFNPVKVFHLWNFLVGINYSSNHFNGDFENQLFFTTPRTYRIEAKYSIIRVPIVLEYSFPAKKIQPFLSVGYNNVFILNPEADIKVVFDNDLIGETVGELDFQKYQCGLLSGIGVRYIINDKSNIFLKSDFEYRIPSSSFSRTLDYQRVMALIFNIGYSFAIK